MSDKTTEAHNRMQAEKSHAVKSMKAMAQRHKVQCEESAAVEAATKIHDLRGNEIQRLRKENATLTAERDEARRLLKSMFDLLKDDMLSTQIVPRHDCGYDLRRHIGICKVCEDWTKAWELIYPGDFQDEEGGK